MVSVPARRAQVRYATGKGLSQRRACTLMRVARSSLGYRSRMSDKDAPVLARMAELAALYPRYGYRRIAIFLRRDGWRMSFGRAHRLWRQARLQVPRKANSKRGREPWLELHKSWMRKYIETTIGEVEKLFPKKIHATNLNGFLLKIALFLFAFQIEKAVI